MGYDMTTWLCQTTIRTTETPRSSYYEAIMAIFVV